MENENCKLILPHRPRNSPRNDFSSKFEFAICIFQFSIFTALFLLSSPGKAQRPQPTPTPLPPQDVDVIKTETDLTNLFFTATDKNNRYVTTLQQNDIRVIEDGVAQTLFTFQRETDRPLSIAFLIDVSISEERTLPDEKAAARTFIPPRSDARSRRETPDPTGDGQGGRQRHQGRRDARHLANAAATPRQISTGTPTPAAARRSSTSRKAWRSAKWRSTASPARRACCAAIC